VDRVEWLWPLDLVVVVVVVVLERWVAVLEAAKLAASYCREPGDLRATSER